MENGGSGKPVIQGFILFSRNGNKGQIAVNNCNVNDIADCIVAAVSCLQDRGLNSFEIMAVIGDRARRARFN